MEFIRNVLKDVFDFKIIFTHVITNFKSDHEIMHIKHFAHLLFIDSKHVVFFLEIDSLVSMFIFPKIIGLSLRIFID